MKKEISYEIFINEILNVLEKNKIWVLSTSFNNEVSSRSMSIINENLTIFFQTNKCYVKDSQMRQNPKISLCCNNISIEGIAEPIGNWLDEKNRDLLELYKKSHLGSFEYYGLLEGQVVYKINPKIIKVWKYIDKKPFREIAYVDEKQAFEMNFM
ncbi:MAG: hypothetical protein JW924_06130 [Fusobacteriaceae bacterium]|nr:hypothetical protein [Fusobacteriaceae bacterium]